MLSSCSTQTGLRGPTLPGRHVQAVTAPFQQRCPARERSSVKARAMFSITSQLVTTALIAGAWYLSQQQDAVEQVCGRSSQQAAPIQAPAALAHVLLLLVVHAARVVGARALGWQRLGSPVKKSW